VQEGETIVQKLRYVFAGVLLLLAACGPADVDQAAEDAAQAVGSIAPSDLAQAGDALASAAANTDVGALTGGVLSEADLNALLAEAQTTVQGLAPSDLRLNQNEPLVLNTTQQVAGVTNYRWVITDVPAGAESVRGAVIDENSNGQLTIAPGDYAQYFPVAGNYTVTLELTYENGTKERTPIAITVP
jgi:hypothetical protein